MKLHSPPTFRLFHVSQILNSHYLMIFIYIYHKMVADDRMSNNNTTVQCVKKGAETCRCTRRKKRSFGVPDELAMILPGLSQLFLILQYLLP